MGAFVRVRNASSESPPPPTRFYAVLERHSLCLKLETLDMGAGASLLSLTPISGCAA